MFVFDCLLVYWPVLNISKLSILFSRQQITSLSFCSPKKKKKTFLKFCVKVQVFLHDGSTLRKYYCLHFRRLFCRSGIDRHRRRKRISQEAIHKLAEHFFMHIHIHEIRVKALLENMESRGLIRTRSRPELPHFFKLPLLQQRRRERRVRPRVQMTAEPSQTGEVDQHEIPESAPVTGHEPVFLDEQNEFRELKHCFQLMYLILANSTSSPETS